MEYPFRMYGEIVEIYRYQITYTEGEGPEAQQVTQGFPTLEEARTEGERHGVTPEPLDTATYEWMEGLTFPTRNDAMAVYDLGEAGYKETLKKEEAEKGRLETQVTELQLALADSYEQNLQTQASAEKQTTDLQLALAELYELIMKGGVV